MATLMTELMDMRRCKRLWRAARRKQSAFARWADRLFDQESLHTKAILEIQAITGRSANRERDPELCKRFRRIKTELKVRRGEQPTRVVFFGDGSFSSCARGSVPIARKEFLKVASATGPIVWTDEFRTSKMCPCGSPNGELRDRPSTSTNACSRLRCHKTVSTASTCPLNDLECTTVHELFDRDVLASVNLLQIAESAMLGNARPNHLCRKR